jgi:hypothetical protein
MKSNLRVANRIRAAINRLNKLSCLTLQAHFECFDNCREQGFILKVFRIGDCQPFYVAFTENRNSDDIVVYCYRNTAFPTNMPATDADWEDKVYFLYEEIDRAARYILNRTQRFLKEK